MCDLSNGVYSNLPCCNISVSFTEASERSDFNQIAVGCISLKLPKIIFFLFPPSSTKYKEANVLSSSACTFFVCLIIFSIISIFGKLVLSFYKLKCHIYITYHMSHSDLVTSVGKTHLICFTVVSLNHG